MKNFKTYGIAPYNVLLIHGGPGAKGDLQPVAEKLGYKYGVAEPFQSKLTIEELIFELNKTIDDLCNSPVYLCGHSWGAWLSYIYSGLFPTKVKKLVLVGSAPFEENYAKDISSIRNNRMSDIDKKYYEELLSELRGSTATNKNEIMRNLGLLYSRIDSFDPIDIGSDSLEVNFNQFSIIWGEASKLRASGQLIDYASKIICPVVAIHGAYDPHPYQGVFDPLSKYISDFKHVLIENCGHKPWIERNAMDKFYSVLYQELQ
jgi:pimeloyl-ACP methyl ester carboxylesterase